MNIFEIFQTEGSIDQSLLAGIVQYQNYWLAIKESIDTLFQTLQFNRQTLSELWQSIYQHCEKLVTVVVEYYRNKFHQALQTTYLPEMRAILAKQDHDKSIKVFQYVANVHQCHKEFLNVLSQTPTGGFGDRNRNSKLAQSLTSELKVALLQLLDFHSVIEMFFRNEYLKHSRCIISNGVGEHEPETIQLIKRKSSDIESRFDRATVKKALRFLVDIDLYDRMLATISNISSLDLSEFLKECEPCISDNQPFLHRCEVYFANFHATFELMIEECLTEILPFDVKADYIARLKRSQEKYRNNIYFFYAKLCNRKIFDIVLAFPDSDKLVMDLKKSIERTGMLNDLADDLNEAIAKRLLIPGVITQGILNQYINMLKILQILDPNGMIFDRVTLPIKNYLLRRNDTLRCTISHLTEDSGNYNQLISQVVRVPSKEHFDDMSSDEDEQSAERWQVLPLVHKNSQIRVKYHEIDLVTVLVNLYGSQEAFIAEYQNMLAEKLMSAKDYNIDEQIKNLEQLKIRFGESALQTCNIIVKDVKDSRRTDNLIHKEPKTVTTELLHPDNLHCLQVSKGYWPINYDSSSHGIPESLKPVFDDYAAKFTKTKAMRKIQFHYNLGYVNLELSFDNGQFNFKCLPVHAILISCFADKEMERLRTDRNDTGLSIETLAKELNLPQTVIKQRMSFWVHKMVIREGRAFAANKGPQLRRMNSFENENETVMYYPVKEYHGLTNTEDDILYDETDEMIMRQNASLEIHQTRIIEGLVLSILNTNGAKSAEKIHLLLRTVYKNDLNMTFGEAQTKEILKKMVARKKLAFNGEVYSAIVET